MIITVAIQPLMLRPFLIRETEILYIMWFPSYGNVISSALPASQEVGLQQHLGAGIINCTEVLQTCGGTWFTPGRWQEGALGLC